MMSGGGLFPRFALPRNAADTHDYWLQLQSLAGCRNFDQLCAAPVSRLFDAVEQLRRLRKDNLYNTMPVVDGLLIPDAVDRLMKKPLKLDYMLGFAGDERMLLLFKRVCRAYWQTYPEDIAWYIMEYRKWYDPESLVGTEYEYLLDEIGYWDEE
jgi:para-nitrobenzyl esterase